MKTTSILAAGGSLFALVCAAVAQTPPPAPSGPAPALAPSAAAAPHFTEEQLVEEFGWFIANKVGLPSLQFTPAESEALVRGFSAALQGKQAPYDFQQAAPQMTAFLQQKQQAYLQKLKQQNSAETTDFFNKLKENKNVVELPSGLRYEIVKPGDGPYPKPEDTVTVNYTGRLINGTVFDSSVQRGKPAEFALNQVIKGWTEGIQKINKGGTIKLYIPPDLAYGDDGRPGIPPGSTLIFDVDLLDIKPAAPAAAAPAAPAVPATPAQ